MIAFEWSSLTVPAAAAVGFVAGCVLTIRLMRIVRREHDG